MHWPTVWVPTKPNTGKCLGCHWQRQRQRQRWWQRHNKDLGLEMFILCHSPPYSMGIFSFHGSSWFFQWRHCLMWGWGWVHPLPLACFSAREYLSLHTPPLCRSSLHPCEHLSLHTSILPICADPQIWIGHLSVPLSTWAVSTCIVIAYSPTADPPCILGTLRLILSGFYPSVVKERWLWLVLPKEALSDVGVGAPPMPALAWGSLVIAY